MAKLEMDLFTRVVGVMILAVGCGEVQPKTIPDSVPIVSYTPEPEAATTVLLEENKDSRLDFGQWRSLFNNKLVLRNWRSRDGLRFNAQGLEYWFKECQLESLPGSAQITFVLSHPWPSALEVVPGTRDVSISMALETLNEVDINAHLIAGLCVGTEISRGYREGGKGLPPDQIRKRVNEKAADFRVAIQVGEVPRVMTTGSSS